MTDVLHADPAITCQEHVPHPENGIDLCTTMSRYVVERSDGDESFGFDGKHESCEAHLAEVVTGMAAGHAEVRAVVTIRWDAVSQGERVGTGCDYGSDRDSGWCENPAKFIVRGDGTEGTPCAAHLAWTVTWLTDAGVTPSVEAISRFAATATEGEVPADANGFGWSYDEALGRQREGSRP